jgi:hypothetical protein
LEHVTRFIDPENVGCLFRVAVKRAGTADTDSEKLHQVQVKALNRVLGGSDLRKRSPVKRCIDELHRSFRKAVCKQATLAGVVQYKEKLEKQVEESAAEVGEALESVTETVHRMMQEQVKEGVRRPAEGVVEKEEIREALKLVYTVDCVLRRDEEVEKLAGRFAA